MVATIIFSLPRWRHDSLPPLCFLKNCPYSSPPSGCFSWFSYHFFFFLFLTIAVNHYPLFFFTYIIIKKKKKKEEQELYRATLLSMASFPFSNVIINSVSHFLVLLPLPPYVIFSILYLNTNFLLPKPHFGQPPPTPTLSLLTLFLFKKKKKPKKGLH